MRPIKGRRAAATAADSLHSVRPSVAGILPATGPQQHPVRTRGSVTMLSSTAEFHELIEDMGILGVDGLLYV